MNRAVKIILFIVLTATFFTDQLFKLLAEKIPNSGIFLFNNNVLVLKLDLILNQNLAFGLAFPTILIIAGLICFVICLYFYLSQESIWLSTLKKPRLVASIIAIILILPLFIDYKQFSQLTLIVALLIFLLALWRRNSQNINLNINLAFALIIASALSNLSDRLIRGGVLDYLSFSMLNYTWPTFNFADALIVCAGLYLLINFKKIEV